MLSESRVRHPVCTSGGGTVGYRYSTVHVTCYVLTDRRCRPCTPSRTRVEAQLRLAERSPGATPTRRLHSAAAGAHSLDAGGRLPCTLALALALALALTTLLRQHPQSERLRRAPRPCLSPRCEQSISAAAHIPRADWPHPSNCTTCQSRTGRTSLRLLRHCHQRSVMSPFLPLHRLDLSTR